MVNTKKVEMTEQHKKELETELERLKVTELTRIAQAIKEAREQGDLSENADYSSAREEQSKINARILEIEDDLKHAVIVKATSIKVLYVNEKIEREFQIAGSQSDPFNGKISSDSPLAKAVIGHKSGDVVYFTTETGKDVEVKILYINVEK